MRAAQALFFAYGAVIAATLFGWVLNVIALAGMDWGGGLTIESVMRIIGVPVVPIGAALGLFF